VLGFSGRVLEFTPNRPAASHAAADDSYERSLAEVCPLDLILPEP
jgi:hypothetical protein